MNPGLTLEAVKTRLQEPQYRVFLADPAPGSIAACVVEHNQKHQSFGLRQLAPGQEAAMPEHWRGPQPSPAPVVNPFPPINEVAARIHQSRHPGGGMGLSRPTGEPKGA